MAGKYCVLPLRGFHEIGLIIIIELDDGNIYRKALYLMLKTLVSGFDFPNKTNPVK
jgi:hypothetical protein